MAIKKREGGRDKMSKYFFLSVCSKQTVMLQTHINMLEKNFKYLLETKNPYLMNGRNVTLNTKINSLTSKHIRKKLVGSAYLITQQATTGYC